MFGFLSSENLLEQAALAGFIAGFVAALLLGTVVLGIVSRRLKALAFDNENIHAKLNDIRLTNDTISRIVQREADERAKRHDERIERRRICKERREAFERGVEVGQSQRQPFREASCSAPCRHKNKARHWNRHFQEAPRDETIHNMQA